MFKPHISVKQSGPGIQGVQASLDVLRNSDVLVGIPESNNTRDDATGIGNAALLYIHTHGSPINNIPPRPLIEPAITYPPNREQINEQLKQAAQAVLANQPTQARMFLNRAGQVALNRVKEWFFTPLNAWPPNKPATIKRKGSDVPLIDTGSLRKSLTFIVREKGKQ